MNVNLTASQRLLSAAIPYLKLGVDPSVVIVGYTLCPTPMRSRTTETSF